MGTIKILQSPNYVPGVNNVKLAQSPNYVPGTGGMKAGVVMSGGGALLGSRSNPVPLSISSNVLTYAYDSVDTLIDNAEVEAKYFKITVPAGQTVSIDIDAPLFEAKGKSEPAVGVRVYEGYTTVNSGDSGINVVIFEMNQYSWSDNDFSWNSQYVINNSFGASSLNCVIVMFKNDPANTYNVNYRCRSFTLGAATASDIQYFTGWYRAPYIEAGTLTDWGTTRSEISVIVDTYTWDSASYHNNFQATYNSGQGNRPSGGPDYSDFVRARLRSGDDTGTWTNLANTYFGKKIQINDLLKPNGNPIVLGDVGDTYSLEVESSADGASWSQVGSITLNVTDIATYSAGMNATGTAPTADQVHGVFIAPAYGNSWQDYALTNWQMFGGVVGIAIDDPLLGAPNRGYLWMGVQNEDNSISRHFRASIDGGANWVLPSANEALNAYYNSYPWVLDLKNLVKPGGGVIGVGDIGSSYTLVVESSTDGSSWSQIASLPFSIFSAS